MATSEERQKILQMISTGKITADEGTRLLAALSGNPLPDHPLPPEQLQAAPGAYADQAASTDRAEETAAEREQSAQREKAPTPESEVIDPSPPIDVQMPDTRHWWQVPFWIGTAVLIAGAFIVAGALSSGAVCLVLLCGLPLLFAGLIGIIVAWFARNGPWVHIRVKNDRPGEHNVNISVPLDLGVVAVRVAEPFVPQMRNTGLDDVIVSLKDNVKRDQPVIIDVNDDEDGEHVQVIVG
jgi:hypothetical protein